MAKILTAVAITAALAKATDEAKKESLINQIIESVTAQEAENAKQKEAFDAQAEELAKAKTDLATAEAAKVEAEKNADDALQTISELSKQLSARENNPDLKGPVVEIGGKSYAIIGNNFITNKGRITAKELAKDEALLADMLKKGSGALKELNDGSTSKSEN